MQKKIALFLCLSLLVALLPPVPASAAEEKAAVARSASNYKYSETVDKHAGMDGAQWFIRYTPEFKYKYEWGIFKFGKEEEYRNWTILEMLYSFDRHNLYEGYASVGLNLSDLDIIFDYVYASVDSAGRKLVSTSSFTYSLIDYDKGSKTFDFAFDYQEILSGSGHYRNGMPTVVTSVKVTVAAPLLGLCGTSVVYDFTYEGDDAARSICTGISYSTYNPVSGLVFLSDTVDFFRDGDMSKEYYMCTVFPGSGLENVLTVLSVVREFLVNFPKMLLNFLTNMVTFVFVDFPGYVAGLFPFFPAYLVDGFVYCMYFTFLLSLYRLVRRG